MKANEIREIFSRKNIELIEAEGNEGSLVTLLLGEIAAQLAEQVEWQRRKAELSAELLKLQTQMASNQVDMLELQRKHLDFATNPRRAAQHAMDIQDALVALEQKQADEATRPTLVMPKGGQ